MRVICVCVCVCVCVSVCVCVCVLDSSLYKCYNVKNTVNDDNNGNIKLIFIMFDNNDGDKKIKLIIITIIH